MSYQPKIGLALPTLNAMPYLKKAFDAIKETGYKNLEFFVQDGLSSDGTLEYLERQKKYFKINLVTSKDNGPGEAFSKALKRIKGCDFIVMISSDEMLCPNFFNIHLENFRKNPNILFIYGSSLLFDSKRKIKQVFHPDLFSLEKIATCDTVPPLSTCMFNAKVLDKDLYFIDTFGTCNDFEFWVRIALKYPQERILKVNDILSIARMDEVSMSFRTDAYLRMARDKVSGLKTIFDKGGDLKSFSVSSQNYYFISIYCWAAELVYRLEGAEQNFVDIVCEAIQEYGTSDKILNLLSKSDELKEWFGGGCKNKVIIKNEPLRLNNPKYTKNVDIKSGEICKQNNVIKKFSFRRNLKLKGGNQDWGYIWNLNFEKFFEPNNPISAFTCHVVVHKGQIGLSILNGDEMEKETILVEENEIKIISLKVRNTIKHPSFCLRNGGAPYSEVTLLKTILHYSKVVNF